MSLYCVKCGTLSDNYKCSKCQKLVAIEEQNFLFPLDTKCLDLINKENMKNEEKILKENSITKKDSIEKVHNASKEDSMLDFMKNNKRKIAGISSDTIYKPIKSPNEISRKVESQVPRDTSTSSNVNMNENNKRKGLSLKVKRIITLVVLFLSIVSFVGVCVSPLFGSSVNAYFMFWGFILIFPFCFLLVGDLDIDNYNFLKSGLALYLIFPVYLYFKNLVDFNCVMLLVPFCLVESLLVVLLSYFDFGKKTFKSSLYMYYGIIICVIVTVIKHIL